MVISCLFACEWWVTLCKLAYVIIIYHMEFFKKIYKRVITSKELPNVTVLNNQLCGTVCET